MGTFGIVVSVIVILGVVGLLINRKAVATMFGAGRAQLGKLGRAAGDAGPLATFQQTVDDSADSIRRAKEGMTKAVALVNSVERQVNTGRTTQARLSARVQNALNEGNQAKATEYAAQLAECESHLKEDEAQLAHHKESYENFVSEVKRQQAKVTTAQREATNLGVRLEMSKANKEFHDFESTFKASNGALAGLDEKREAVLRKIDQNNAYQQVDKDVGGSTSSGYEEDDAEVDRKLAGDKVLKRFQKEEQAPFSNSSNKA